MRKLISTAFALMMLAGTASAADIGINGNIDLGDGSLTKVGPRLAKSDIRYAVTSRDGMVTLMLSGNAVAVQLTDKALQEAHEEKGTKDEGALAAVFEGAIRAGVESVLRRSLTVALSDIRSASYHDGRVVLIGRDGAELFAHMSVNDKPLMMSFTPEDAVAFVRLVQRTK